MTTRRKTGAGKVQEQPVARRRTVSKAGGPWKRKNMLMDQRKLDRALLGVDSETDAVDAALDLVASRPAA